MMSKVVLESRPVLMLSMRNAAWGPQSISPGDNFQRASTWRAKPHTNENVLRCSSDVPKSNKGK